MADTPHGRPRATRRNGYILLILCLCGFVLSSAIWSFVAEVDVSASTTGKIVPKGQVKYIQPFEKDEVAEIRVSEGARVAAGDVLIRLDDTDAASEVQRLTDQLNTQLLVEARIKAILDGSDGRSFTPPPGVPADIVETNRKLMNDQLQAQRVRKSELDNQIAERTAAITAIKTGMVKLEKLIPILRERVEMRRKLFASRSGSRLNLLDDMERLVSLESDIQLQRDQLAEAQAALARLRDTRRLVDLEFHRDLTAKLTESQRATLKFVQELRQAKERLEKHTLISPIDGYVQDLLINTIGGIVEPGDRLMTIVPEGEELQVEALVSNADIGFVRVGQEADIRITTFDFRRYGSIGGRVAHVSTDVVDQRIPSNAEEGRVGAGQSTSLSTETSTGPVYKAIIDLDTSAMEINGETIPLRAGMTVEASILLGKQRIADFVLEPLIGYRETALRER